MEMGIARDLSVYREVLFMWKGGRVGVEQTASYSVIRFIHIQMCPYGLEVEEHRVHINKPFITMKYPTNRHTQHDYNKKECDKQ